MWPHTGARSTYVVEQLNVDCVLTRRIYIMSYVVIVRYNDVTFAVDSNGDFEDFEKRVIDEISSLNQRRFVGEIGGFPRFSYLFRGIEVQVTTNRTFMTFLSQASDAGGVRVLNAAGTSSGNVPDFRTKLRCAIDSLEEAAIVTAVQSLSPPKRSTPSAAECAVQRPEIKPTSKTTASDELKRMRDALRDLESVPPTQLTSPRKPSAPLAPSPIPPPSYLTSPSASTVKAVTATRNQQPGSAKGNCQVMRDEVEVGKLSVLEFQHASDFRVAVLGICGLSDGRVTFRRRRDGQMDLVGVDLDDDDDFTILQAWASNDPVVVDVSNGGEAALPKRKVVAGLPKAKPTAVVGSRQGAPRDLD